MIIDNGRQRRLVIPGVHDGVCGDSDGLLSFIPNIAAPPRDGSRGGTLDGEPMLLTLIKPRKGNPFWTAIWRPAA